VSSLLITETTEDAAAWLTVTVDWVTGVVVLSGELDRDTAHHFGDAVTALTATDHRCWVVDTAAVTFCDVAGLRSLAAAHALAQQQGCRLLLVRPSRCIDRLVTLSGLDRLIATQPPARSAR
jgi:anti-anti-sigma factor